MIFPNPVKDFLTIQSKENRELSYRIFSAAGELTGKGISIDKKINAEKLAPGNYVIELTDKDGNTSSSKFIKL
ncbi:T9SS type A sorting domain-containing protein [Chryseobacterium koreense]|uniref:Secretion system C-terminal sorting domain-containing protein n=1 Tax=Chryseobacterium koreense CCUG 49689 TaxID=1304281 RepID=A0A0J7LUW3_9FLAO|nr:T9SS type A sorting domain-containing protein [Chryseobacterium koreense]KMQ72695.1 hypothetical protein ACM44_00980 [Chryseobacterium koreense CCUG 49689]MBB5333099.1 hypothetical protein [Chryseobacterium koreense]